MTVGQFIERNSIPSAQDFIDTWKMVESGEISVNNSYKVLDIISKNKRKEILEKLALHPELLEKEAS